MPVNPSIAAVLAQVDAHPAPRVIDNEAEVLREVSRRMGAGFALPEPIEVGSVEGGAVPGPAGRMPVRVYRPAGGGPVPTVVFFHGGGRLTGDLDTHDDVARRMCREVNAAVVAVGYRPAPEHPFPAAYDDCPAAAHHVADHIDGFGGRRDRFADVLELQHLYTGDDPAVRASFRVSPLRAGKLTGLAPAVIGTAQYDPLRDEGARTYEGLIHTFLDLFPVSPAADAAVTEPYARLKRLG